MKTSIIFSLMLAAVLFSCGSIKTDKQIYNRSTNSDAVGVKQDAVPNGDIVGQIVLDTNPDSIADDDEIIPTPDSDDDDDIISPPGVYDYLTDIVLSSVGETSFSGQNYSSDYYLDVMTHTNDRYLSANGATTDAHESMHGLLNEMNNATSANDQFIYFENGRGAYVLEPAMNSNLIKNYVPGAVAGMTSRYNLYLVQQISSFPNVLYQFDEWKAYVTGARVGIEMYDAGTWTTGGQDVVDGAMDFLYFCSAALQALKVNEPTYLTGNTQFKAVFAMLAEQTIEYVELGLQAPPFAGFHAEEMLQHFVNSPENEEIRVTLKEIYGEEWTLQTFGF